MWYSLFFALLATGTKAFAPAPIRWGGLPSNKFILACQPNSLRNKDIASLRLTIGDPLGKISPNVVPYFLAQPDSTITWDTMGMRMCMEASGFTSGQQVRVNQCTEDSNQRWNWLPWGPIQLKGTNQCLDIVPGNEGGLDGAPIELRECDREKASELWKFEQPISQSISSHSSAAQPAMAFLASMVAVGALSVGALLRRSQKRVHVEAVITGGDNDNAGGVCLTGRLVAREGSRPFGGFSDKTGQSIIPDGMAQNPIQANDQDGFGLTTGMAASTDEAATRTYFGQGSLARSDARHVSPKMLTPPFPDEHQDPPLPSCFQNKEHPSWPAGGYLWDPLDASALPRGIKGGKHLCMEERMDAWTDKKTGAVYPNSQHRFVAITERDDSQIHAQEEPFVEWLDRIGILHFSASSSDSSDQIDNEFDLDGNVVDLDDGEFDLNDGDFDLNDGDFDLNDGDFDLNDGE